MTQAYDLFMVFDVEAIGLHGQGFAFGYLIIQRDGKVLDENVYSCNPDYCTGHADDRDWVKANVPPLMISHPNVVGLRKAFWDVWEMWKSKGATLVADCPWPVEANFLEACIKDNIHERKGKGPYPFIDIASLQLCRNIDPLVSTKRLIDELPMHHPLSDARQSARQLIELLKGEE